MKSFLMDTVSIGACLVGIIGATGIVGASLAAGSFVHWGFFFCVLLAAPWLAAAVNLTEWAER